MHDPATGEYIAKAQLSTIDDIRMAALAARTAFEQTAWSRDGALRAKVLLVMADLIRKNKEDLAHLYSRNNGKTIREARLELTGCADIFSYTAGMARNIFGRFIEPAPNSLSCIIREPMGVVGIISPWNWPIQLMVREMVPALAAGNSVVLKPASQTAAISMKFCSLLHQTEELPKGIINAVTGSGAEIGDALCVDPDVRMISFTGSSEVGARIARLATAKFKKVVLELGGKSPNILFADCDVEKACTAAIPAAFMTSGQLCMAGTRLLVQEAIFDQVVTIMKEKTEDLKIGIGIDESTDLGPLISCRQLESTLAYIEIGKKEGRLVTGGKRLTGGFYDKGFFVQPTIFTDLPRNSRLVQEEIFGPVLVVQKFKNEAEAISVANDSPYGLVAAVWTKDVQRALRMARAIEAGTVWINTYFKLYHQTEFGGFKDSGIGRTRGIDGIYEFTETKHVNFDING
jgi:betaine-aldehyde dehydrogenase